MEEVVFFSDIFYQKIAPQSDAKASSRVLKNPRNSPSFNMEQILSQVKALLTRSQHEIKFALIVPSLHLTKNLISGCRFFRWYKKTFGKHRQL